MQQFFNSYPLSGTRTQTPTTFPVTGAKKVAPNKKKAPQKKVIASVDYCSTDLNPFSRILSIDSPGPNNVCFNAAGIVFHTNIPIESFPTRPDNVYSEFESAAIASTSRIHNRIITGDDANFDFTNKDLIIGEPPPKEELYGVS